jgi:hypothetical protein
MQLQLRDVMSYSQALVDARLAIYAAAYAYAIQNVPRFSFDPQVVGMSAQEYAESGALMAVQAFDKTVKEEWPDAG